MDTIFRNVEYVFCYIVDILIFAEEKNDKTVIEWTQPLINAFNACKESLANSTILNFINQNASLRLTTDASDASVGAHLEQKLND